MSINIERVLFATFTGVLMMVGVVAMLALLIGCGITPRPPSPTSRPAHYYEAESFKASFYFHDTRTDLCHFAATIAGATNFVLVPCNDQVMMVAIDGPANE
jgi:hypothetical protein